MCCNFFVSSRILLLIAVVSLVIGVGQLVVTDAIADAATEQVDAPDVPAVLNFEVETIEGKTIRLDKYHGDVVLIVNVASKCGLTPQYKQLQQLHDEYAEAGLAILGFPANNFGKQEPGTNDEIVTFCEKNYGVEFDMFAKLSVAGEDQAPLYQFLTSKKTNPDFAGKIRWNFDKFLVNREGQVIDRFAPGTEPTDKNVLKVIEEALAKPVPDTVKAKRKAEAEKPNPE